MPGKDKRSRVNISGATVYRRGGKKVSRWQNQKVTFYIWFSFVNSTNADVFARFCAFVFLENSVRLCALSILVFLSFYFYQFSFLINLFHLECDCWPVISGDGISLISKQEGSLLIQQAKRLAPACPSSGCETEIRLIVRQSPLRN